MNASACRPFDIVKDYYIISHSSKHVSLKDLYVSLKDLYDS